MIAMVGLLMLGIMLAERAKALAPRSNYDDLFRRFGRKYDVSPSMLRAIAEAESSLNPRAIGKNGSNRENWDYGLMQINAKIARGRLLNYRGDLPGILFDPVVSVETAAKLISDNRRISGSRNNADLISAYNWGLRNGKIYRTSNGEYPNPRYVEKVSGRMMVIAAAEIGEGVGALI